MKSIFWFLLLISTLGSAQKSRKAQTKADKLIITALRNHINFLADDKLEGRRTGTTKMKTNKEKNLAHDAKMKDRVRPAPKEYDWEALDRVMRQWATTNEQA